MSVARELHRGATTMRVMAIEDDPDTRHFYERFLREEGHAPILASDGLEAMGLMDHCPDLILLDLGLPMIDGYEILRLLKTSPETRDIPILIVSGRPLTEGVDLAGVVGVVRKPYDLPLLASALRQAAAGRRQRGEPEAS